MTEDQIRAYLESRGYTDRDIDGFFTFLQTVNLNLGSEQNVEEAIHRYSFTDAGQGIMQRRDERAAEMQATSDERDAVVERIRAEQSALSQPTLTEEEIQERADQEVSDYTPRSVGMEQLAAMSFDVPYGETSAALRRTYTQRARQELADNENVSEEEINRHAEQLMLADGVLNSDAWVPFDERIEYQPASIPTLDEMERDLERDPQGTQRRMREVLHQARDLGYVDSYASRMGASTVVRYRQALEYMNALNEQTKEDAIEQLRQASTILATFTTQEEQIDALMGLGAATPQLAAELADEARQYQAAEWMLDTSAVDQFGGISRNQEIYNDRAFMEALPFNNVSLLDAKQMFVTASNDEVAQLQMLMWEMGYYDRPGPNGQPLGPPQFGIIRPGEADLWAQFIGRLQAETGRGMRVGDVVKQLVDSHYENVIRQSAENLEGSIDQNGDGIPDNIFNLSSRETLGRTVDDAVQRLTGREHVDPVFRDELIGRAQEREMAYLRTLNGSFVANRLNQGITGVQDVDIFLEAISGQESGGNYQALNADSGASGRYQFMPSTWRSWARRTGLGAGAPMTPENQDHVARAMASYYYTTFGNWYDAAIAWYMGPGRVGDYSAQVRGQGNYPTGRRYGESILQRMTEIQQGRVRQMGQGAGGVRIDDEGNVFVEEYDRDAYLEHLAMTGDRVGHQTWSYNDRGRDFISMLGSTV